MPQPNWYLAEDGDVIGGDSIEVSSQETNEVENSGNGEEAIIEREDHPLQQNELNDKIEEKDFGFYKLPLKRNRIGPTPFPEFSDKYKGSHLLAESLRKDIAWVLTGMFGERIYNETKSNASKITLPPMGSWTAFRKDTSDVKTSKCNLEYLPVIPFPPKDNVIKWYMDAIVQMAEDLEIEHIFVHSDEAIYSKMVMIMWLHHKKYDKLVPLLGGFHTLLVALKILYKKYGCLGLHHWWVSGRAIKEKSVAEAIEGRKYYRSIGLHKKSINAVLRCRMEKKMPEDEDLKKSIMSLRLHTNSGNLQSLLNLDSFKAYCNDLMIANDGTQCQIMIQYVKDVSLVLALVSAVRDKCTELHIAAERSLIPKCFAFDHLNYARYLTVQHISFERMQLNQPAAWNDLEKDGLGGSLSGQKFSSIHGDLITETTINRETKVRGGPMRGGYSTNLEANDTFIKTSHMMAKIRAKLKDKLHVLTPAVHKEVTPGSRKKHDRIVSNLQQTLEGLVDPFLNGPARHLLTGNEIEKSVIDGLLSSDQIGNECFEAFVKQRITTPGVDKISFFEPIHQTKLKTGMEKKKKSSKALDIIKEDKQAFGLLVGKVSSEEEALALPITTVPLALASPDRLLRSQNTKSCLRNYIIAISGGGKSMFRPSGVVDWYVDGMMAVNKIASKETWKDYADAIFEYCTPADTDNIGRLTIVFDSYSQPSIKQMTQMGRGIAENRVHITSLKQKMPQGLAWEAFMKNPENKMDLIDSLVRRYMSEGFRSKLPFELVVTRESETLLITSANVSHLESCNHVEADTRLILEATKSSNDVIIRAEDTDVLMLMCYAHTVKDIQNEWTLMTDKETFVSISDIRKHVGDDVCSVLPAYHSITGCDTTSYPANVGKIRPFQKMISRNSMHLLAHFGENVDSFHNLDDALKFYHTIMYSGKENETVVGTRVRMFKSQKVKSSVNLISDPASIIQHLLRSDLQTFIWRQCILQNMVLPPLKGRGWVEIEGRIIPLWFEGPRLPPCLSRSKKRVAVKEKKVEPSRKKVRITETSSYELSSDSNSSDSSCSSSDWEMWTESDFDSDTDSDDSDW